MRRAVGVCVLAISVAGCGADSRVGADSGAGAPCTPESQAVSGAVLTFEPHELLTGGVCVPSGLRLLTSMGDVDREFPMGSAPAELAGVDFAVDRVIVGCSNPGLQFVVDDGAQLVAGEESFCEGAAPTRVVNIVRATTRSMLRSVTCPYRGPTPCLAP